MVKFKVLLKACLCVLTCAFLIMPVLTGCKKDAAVELPDINPGYCHAEYEGMTDKGAAFLACGTGGRLDRIFEDGTHENVPLPTGEKNLTTVFIGGDITLVGGASGALAYSRDSKEFSASKGVGKEHILGLTHFNGRYYACTYSGNIFSSADGALWITDKRLTDKPLIAIASDNVCIMAITNDTDIFISIDGENWELQNYNKVYEGLATKQTFLNMRNIGEAFIILGYDAEYPDMPTLMFSYDVGETWMYSALIKINKRHPEEFYPLTYNSVCLFMGETLVACNRGRVLTITSCPTCNLIMEASSAELRCMAANDNTLLVAGEDFEFKILDSAELRQDEISEY